MRFRSKLQFYTLIVSIASIVSKTPSKTPSTQPIVNTESEPWSGATGSGNEKSTISFITDPSDFTEIQRFDTDEIRYDSDAPIS